MYYLHEHNIYYGDMKPENLLVFRDLSVRLGDLGVSMIMKEHANQVRGCTEKYVDPTLL